jgi:hypothetical protein
MNRLTIRQPTQVVWTDTRPVGFGRYNLREHGWRTKIQTGFTLQGDRCFNKSFKFKRWWSTYGSSTALDTSTEAECGLLLGDNTSALEWLVRYSRVDRESLSFDAIQLLARKVGILIMHSPIMHSPHCRTFPHTKGKHNVVSDLLTFEKSERGCLRPIGRRYVA